MTRDEIESAEMLLIEIATTKDQIEEAILFINHGMNDTAINRLRQALSILHTLKLKAMVSRWLDCPDTLKQLIQEQCEWPR